MIASGRTLWLHGSYPSPGLKLLLAVLVAGSCVPQMDIIMVSGQTCVRQGRAHFVEVLRRSTC